MAGLNDAIRTFAAIHPWPTGISRHKGFPGAFELVNGLDAVSAAQEARSQRPNQEWAIRSAVAAVSGAKGSAKAKAAPSYSSAPLASSPCAWA